MLRMTAVDLIESAGFIAIEAANADKALALLDQHQNVQLVFTDIQMPGSLDGLALAAHVRKTNPSVGIIVTSGLISPEPEALPERTAFLPKPYHEHHVMGLIRSMIA